jgi:hypothetical protein
MRDTKLAVEKIFTVQQHIGCNKHIQAVQISNKKKSLQMLMQQCLSGGGNKSSDFFFSNLYDALVSRNISFWAVKK